MKAVFAISPLKALTALALFAVLAAILYFALFAPVPAGAQSTTDYDTDSDNLIEISDLDQLNAIRYDLNGDGVPAANTTATTAYAAAFPGGNTADTSTPYMGCAAACVGYELMANLDFAADGAAVTSTDSYPNWEPIVDPGNDNSGYTAIFEGNGHTISRLTISNQTDRDVGLFDELEPTGVIRNVGIIDVNIEAGGALDGYAPLVGRNERGTIIASYARGGTVTATTQNSSIGGLTGRNSGTILASYSTVTVNGSNHIRVNAGGLTGTLETSFISGNGQITASYAAGAVSATGNNSTRGGLVGNSASGSNRIYSSYCTSGGCIGGTVGGSGNLDATTQTAAALQTPTGYTGIYALWNVDLSDDDPFPDNPWNFGATTTYPVLNAPDQRAGDHDADDDNLIDVGNLYQLNAIRHDLNGDGLPDATGNNVAYAGAFPGGDFATTTTSTTTPRLGCPDGCLGYELTGNLDFDADGMNGVTTTDPFPNWTAIGPLYTAAFDGGGHTIANLTINISSGGANAGLFNTLGTGGVIRNVGLTAPNVTVGAGGGQQVGTLLARNLNGNVHTSYAQGGTTTISRDGARAGGLVGETAGAIRASYAAVTVDAGAATGSSIGGLTGYVNAGTIIASYAAGTTTGTGAGTNVGGLAGTVDGSASSITNSYCDATILGSTSTCVGSHTVSASSTLAASAGYTTAELQTPTEYFGIYAQWNISLDLDTTGDHPWNFGSTTTYPVPTRPDDREVDYDLDNDGLIEVSSLLQLNALQYNMNGYGRPDTSTYYAAYAAAFPGGATTSTAPSATTTADGRERMGCPGGDCRGYELTRSLDFDTDGSGSVDSGDQYPTWRPIGAIQGNSFVAVFDGNGYTISNMNISQGHGAGGAGLFQSILSPAVIRDLGIINPTVQAGGASDPVGALTGNNGGIIRTTYVQGGTISTVGSPLDSKLGGLAGANTGFISASYASTTVIAGAHNDTDAGGLVGQVTNGAIRVSYAASPVSATGTATGTRIGGLVGNFVSSAAELADSYCDVTALGSASIPCIGATGSGVNVTATGYTAAQLQAPTGYTGIYLNWNIDIDDPGDDFPDNPWNFGAATTHPIHNTPEQRRTAEDYDSDGDNLIDVTTLWQLNAIRYDLDGNGLPDDGLPGAAGDYVAYAGAFPGGNLADTGTPYMGCAAACAGYELMNDLDFDLDGGGVSATDPYPDWTPIGGATGYESVFDGKGYTISNMTIADAVGNSGLFNTLTADAVIRDVGMVDAAISNEGTNAYVGALAGNNNGGMIITSYARGGAIYIDGTSTYGGGLLGRNTGDVRAVYARVSVDAGSAASSTIGGLIGLHTGTGSTTAAYAAGAVTSTGANAFVGGLVGEAEGAAAIITNSYCDTTVNGTSTPCVANHQGGATATSTGYTTAQLQGPTDYTGIYESWNIPLGSTNTFDDPWDFGGVNDYPTIKALASRVPMTPQPPPPPPTPTPTPTTPTTTPPTTPTTTPPTTPEPTPTPTPDPGPGDGGNGGDGGSATSTDTLPPALPRTIPPEPDTPYNPAADHPEIYNNAEYEMAATCQTHDVDPETGNPRAATVTFDLGSYTGPVLLHLSIWSNGRYMAYETQGIALPTLERDGQRAWVRVATDPARTRFRIDGRLYGLAANLVLGYADCHTDTS